MRPKLDNITVNETWLEKRNVVNKISCRRVKHIYLDSKCMISNKTEHKGIEI